MARRSRAGSPASARYSASGNTIYDILYYSLLKLLYNILIWCCVYIYIYIYRERERDTYTCQIPAKPHRGRQVLLAPRPEGGHQGFQGYDFHLSTNHFVILRLVSGSRRLVFLFLRIGLLNSILRAVSLESPRSWASSGRRRTCPSRRAASRRTSSSTRTASPPGWPSALYYNVV